MSMKQLWYSSAIVERLPLSVESCVDYDLIRAIIDLHTVIYLERMNVYRITLPYTTSSSERETRRSRESRWWHVRQILPLFS